VSVNENNPNGIIKLYCVVARESLKKMNGIRGKMMTQAGHGYVHAIWDSYDRFPEMVEKYRQSERAFKITLAVDTVEELQALHDKYQPICGVSLVTDCGLTVFKEPTTTCLGIGPIESSMVGKDISSLPLLS